MKTALGAFILLFSLSAHADPALYSLESEAAEDHANGCPEGSYDWVASSDNQFLTMKFYEFEIEAGISTPGRSQSAEKRCDLLGRIRVPAGWMVGIESVTVLGNARASDLNSRGYIENNYATEQSRRPVTLLSQSFNGPFSGDFDLPGRLPRDSIHYTTCSPFNTEQRLNLTSVLSAQTTGFGETAISNHRSSRAIVHEYRFIWTRCGGGGDPLPQEWTGSCRVVLETIWGQDFRDFYGRARGRTESEARDAARQDGHSACQDFRNNDNLYRCVTDSNRCFATRQ